MAFRDGPFENLKVPLVWTAAVAVVVAAVAAGFLLLTDNREDLTASGYSGARGTFDQAAAPVGKVLSAPVRWTGQGSDFIGQYFFAVRENRKLREQVAELESLRDANIALRNVNARYEALLKIRTEPAVPMATARAVSESRGPFVNARLIDAGTKAGVRVGNPVVNEHGLVGRVVGATTGVSRVLLVTDVASRTPVLIDRTDARAIMVGDGGGNPKIEFVRGHGAIKEGDRILTSGDGGVFPRGLPVGVAAKGIDGTWRVRLFSDRGAIDFVRILLFQDFSQLVNPQALNAPPLAALDAAPPPSPELTQRIQEVAPANRQPSAPAPVQAARPAVAAPTTAQPAAQRPAAQTPPRPATTSPTPAPAARKAAPPPATRKASPPARRPDGTPRRPVPYERLNPGGAP
ncbi:MAG TPA: rod shape-determining protein MreC [Caulobacteraceae bacterium]|nr:rod shape-determining protein MreC [Caulobacteraceae bacterium]